MAKLFLPCNNPYDQLRLTVELIRTMRAGMGLDPGVYDASRGGLVVPDDIASKKEKAEEAKAKKAAEAKAKAEAAAIAEAAKKAEEEPKA